MAPPPPSTVHAVLSERTAILNAFKNKPYLPDNANSSTFGTPTHYSLTLKIGFRYFTCFG